MLAVGIPPFDGCKFVLLFSLKTVMYNIAKAE